MDWNWTAHCCGLAAWLAALYFRSGLLVSAGLVLMAVGFLNLSLPMRDGRWRRFVRRAVAFEELWRLEPWGWRKVLVALLMLAGAAFLVWALWAQDLAALGLLAGAGVIAWCVRDNIAGGINP